MSCENSLQNLEVYKNVHFYSYSCIGTHENGITVTLSEIDVSCSFII